MIWFESEGLWFESQAKFKAQSQLWLVWFESWDLWFKSQGKICRKNSVLVAMVRIMNYVIQIMGQIVGIFLFLAIICIMWLWLRYNMLRWKTSSINCLMVNRYGAFMIWFHVINGWITWHLLRVGDNGSYTISIV